jgi:hypothetical protein
MILVETQEMMMIENKNEKISTRLNNSDGSATIIVMVVLAVIYIFATDFSTRGWGYSGYNGYGHGRSFWYFGGANTYHDPSARTGSVGGSGSRGGGLGGGK